MRVFVALDIPEDVRAAIGAVIEKLRPVCPSARWVRIAGIHVTLKFIGEVEPAKVELIRMSLSPLRLPSSIELKFQGLGFFPNERRPRVFWAGIEAGPELAALAASIESALEPLGIEREERAFSPHLTIARLDSLQGPEAKTALNRLSETTSNLGPLEFGSALSSEFHLYQSILKRGGAEYTRLATFRFAGGESQ